MTPMLGAGVSAAAPATISGCSGLPTATGSSGCLARETFDGATSCYSGFTSNCDQTWSYATGDLVFNYTTAPAPLQGTNSLYIPAGFGSKGYFSVTTSGTMYAGAMVRVSSLPVQSNNIFVIESTADTPLCTIQFYGTDTINMLNAGGTTQATTLSLSDSTTFYIKVKAVKGTGADASCTPYYSSNGTSWTEGTASTNGTWTANPAWFFPNGTNSGPNIVMDDVRLSTSDFNYW